MYSYEDYSTAIPLVSPVIILLCAAPGKQFLIISGKVLAKGGRNGYDHSEIAKLWYWF